MWFLRYARKQTSGHYARLRAAVASSKVAFYLGCQSTPVRFLSLLAILCFSSSRAFSRPARPTYTYTQQHGHLPNDLSKSLGHVLVIPRSVHKLHNTTLIDVEAGTFRLHQEFPFKGRESEGFTVRDFDQRLQIWPDASTKCCLARLMPNPVHNTRYFT